MRASLTPLWAGAVIGLASLLPAGGAPAEPGSRDIAAAPREPAAVLHELYEKSWALVIGINRYTKGGKDFPNLSYAVSDAQRVAARLKEMGFEVTLLLDQDATRTNILLALGDDIGRTAGDNDRILFFFAGHGATKERPDKSTMGYILPYDYDPQRHTATAISVQQLREISSLIRAKHMLYLMDSCFSGGMLTSRGRLPSGGYGYQHLSNLTRTRAHVVITAGARDQTVKEEGGSGIFTRVFLDALSKQQNVPWSGAGYLTAMDLASYVQKRVPDLAPNQTPQYGHLEGEGDVVLTIFKPVDVPTIEGRPAGLSPDIEERLRKLEQEQEVERQRRLQQEVELAREREAARREIERLKTERMTAEQARRDAEERARREAERRPPTPAEQPNGPFVPPSF